MSSGSISFKEPQPIEPGDSGPNSGRNSYPASNLSTASVRESIYNYEEQYGRTYHAFRRGQIYCMPNDEPEQDRMDLHYHCLRMLMKQRHWLCPIREPTCVLDVGAGTGIWPIDVADDHPNAKVIGIDLSPIQPTSVPPNVQFQVFDADEDWNFSERFDLVHTRGMNGFCLASWPHFYREAFAHMQPGGWVENQEFDLKFCSDDGTIPPDGALNRWATLWGQGIQNLGLTARCYPEEMKIQMHNAGFINVHIRAYKLPIAPWAKDRTLRQAGMYFLSGFLDGLAGMSYKVFLAGLGWTQEQLEVLLMEVRNEAKLKSIHAYFPVYIVYGQKPPATNGYH